MVIWKESEEMCTQTKLCGQADALHDDLLEIS